MVPISYYILLSAAIFSIGLFGVLTRRNALMFLISIELMLNAANLNFVAFSTLHGQVFSLFVLALAAAEVAVGIGIILVLHRNFSSIDVTKAVTLRW
jgi:NADH-quinone oxidoreductase subunit K